MAQIREIIENKYEILTEIGRGGMSVVYLAMDRRLNKQWAIKEIKKQINDSNNEIVIQSLITEANLMKKLDHPALPRIVDIIDHKSTLYVVMDYIEGNSLNKVLEEQGAIEQRTVIEWAKQLCDALDYLHRRKPPIIYRDMKPANVMLNPDGKLKIIDFGIAREFKEQNVADTVCLGTRGYAAPEQFGGRGQTDARTDIYSLGVTLYHLVTGKNPAEPPYELYPIRYWNPALSGGFEQIILKCTQLDPANRYQNCGELMYALEHYEEIDEKYIKKQRGKIYLFGIMAALTVATLSAGTYFNQMAMQNKVQNYNRLIADADKQTDMKAREQSYLEAMEIIPENIQAYQRLMKVYKENDNKFTAEEASVLIGKVKENQDGIRQNVKDYIELCYEVGKLYWFHYSYGNTEDNQITRVKSAIPWFEDVVQYCEEYQVDFKYLNMAKVFRDIGVFNRDYSINIQEASGKGTYIHYFESLEELRKFLVANQDEDEVVLWEAYKIIAYSLDTYMQKFKSDGVDKDSMLAFCKQVQSTIENLEATDDITLEIQSYVDGIMNDSYGTLMQRIKAAYD